MDPDQQCPFEEGDDGATLAECGCPSCPMCGADLPLANGCPLEQP